MADNNTQLLEIDQMTQIRVNKYGGVLLEVCKRFKEKKMAYLKDKLVAEHLARDDDYESIPSPSGSAPSGWIGKKSKSKGEGAKYFGKGFKRTKKNNESGKKFARRSSSGKVTKNNGSQ